MAFVYDAEEQFDDAGQPRHADCGSASRTRIGRRCCAIWWRATWRRPPAQYAARLLNDWDRELPRFWQVVPKEYVSYLPVPLDEAEAKRA